MLSPDEQDVWSMNKKLSFLFIYSILVKPAFASVESYRKIIKLNSKTEIICERKDELLIECDHSSVAKFKSQKTIPPIDKINYFEGKIHIVLKNKNWEFFGFKKSVSKDQYFYVLDFWKNPKDPKNGNFYLASVLFMFHNFY